MTWTDLKESITQDYRSRGLKDAQARLNALKRVESMLFEIFPDFDFHSLRHTHASMLLEAGAEQKYIQTRLGHSNLKITIDVYEHTTENLRSRGRAVVNKLYN